MWRMGTGNGDQPRLAERHRAERTELIRQEILDAALTEFTERGYQETTIAHIGQRLGSAPSMIYNYFTNKRDILEQAVEGSLTTIMTAFAEATMTLPSTVDEFRAMANRLGDVAVGLVTQEPRLPRMALVMTTLNDPELRERWLGTFQAVKGGVELFLTEGSSAGYLRDGIDIDATARAIIAIPFGMLASDPSLTLDPQHAAALVRATVELVVRGIYRETSASTSRNATDPQTPATSAGA